MERAKKVLRTGEASSPDSECSCHRCISACHHKPGWFEPGEAEKAAKLMGMKFKDFFDKYLGVDWWEESPKPIFLLAPATMVMTAGAEYPGNPEGACVFLKNDRCQIHAAKPRECRETFHNTSDTRSMAMRIDIVRKWRTRQEQPRKLLGREPVTRRCSPFDFLSSMFGSDSEYENP